MANIREYVSALENVDLFFRIVGAEPTSKVFYTMKLLASLALDFRRFGKSLEEMFVIFLSDPSNPDDLHEVNGDKLRAHHFYRVTFATPSVPTEEELQRVTTLVRSKWLFSTIQTSVQGGTAGPFHVIHLGLRVVLDTAARVFDERDASEVSE